MGKEIQSCHYNLNFHGALSNVTVTRKARCRAVPGGPDPCQWTRSGSADGRPDPKKKLGLGQARPGTGSS